MYTYRIPDGTSVNQPTLDIHLRNIQPALRLGKDTYIVGLIIYDFTTLRYNKVPRLQ